MDVECFVLTYLFFLWFGVGGQRCSNLLASKVLRIQTGFRIEGSSQRPPFTPVVRAESCGTFPQIEVAADDLE